MGGIYVRFNVLCDYSNDNLRLLHTNLRQRLLEKLLKHLLRSLGTYIPEPRSLSFDPGESQHAALAWPANHSVTSSSRVKFLQKHPIIRIRASSVTDTVYLVNGPKFQQKIMSVKVSQTPRRNTI